ncbi:sulfatase-like hydrolase/transferase [bacterium]|nr:sulfatase-like hydrolase/transferase [bacterium]MDB4624511.1 sulfatase-like hydrolase/transferase [Rubripirellula sp.]
MFLVSLLDIQLMFCVCVDAKPPNILFIYTDDQSHRTVGCYDEAFDWVKTPNIDQLAREGVRFRRAYIGSWCMPSRATLLTGHHQHGIESMRMEGPYPGSAYNPEQCRFWPSAFRQQGYATAHIGKWHTGVDAGFGRDWDHQKVWNRPRHPENAPNYYDKQLISTDGGEPVMVDGYTTDNYTDWAIDFIQGEARNPEKPWYLWLCYGAVHGPFTPAERHQQDYVGVDVPVPADVYPPRAGKPAYVQEMEFWEPGKDGRPVERKVRESSPVGMKDRPGRPLSDWVRQYHQGVLAIDENVGRLMESLRQTGQLENTLVVFTSDQGFAWGQHGMKSKVAPHDAAVAAPLIIRPIGNASSKEGRGVVVDAPVSGVDLPPTFFSQAGLKLPWKMHGRDLSPLLTGGEKSWTHPAMLVHTAKLYGSATDQIPGENDAALYHGPGIPWYVMLARGDYKYVRTLVTGETEELYDISSDPAELINLAAESKHQDRLRQMRRQAVDELRRTDAGFVDYLPAVAIQPAFLPLSAKPDPWRKHVIARAKGSVNSAVSADFDNDGHVDVLSSYDGKVVLHRGPNWDAHQLHAFSRDNSRNKPRPDCIHSCLLDVDGDGDLDFCGSSNTVFWLECPDDPFSGKAWTYRTIDDEILGTHCLITGDVNQDGRLDLIANSGRGPGQTTIPNSLTWLEVPQDPKAPKPWKRHVFADRDAPGGNHYTGIADVNGDGLPDICCGAKGGPGFEGGEWFAWWEQLPDQAEPWKKHLLAANQPGATNIQPLDVNQDGTMDFVATRGHGQGVLWFRGPEFTMLEIDSEIEGPHCLVLVDLDEDGDVDVATCGKEPGGLAVWYANDGDGNFVRHEVGSNQGAYDIRAVDMDGDHDLDLLIAGHSSKNIVWFENPLP